MISYRSRAFSLMILALVTILSCRAVRAATWQKVAQISIVDYVTCAYFFDQNEGLIGFSSRTAIYRTTDGGVSWRPMKTPTTSGSIRMTDIWFRDTKEGWATMNPDGGAGTLWHTTDGGYSWSSTLRTATACSVRQTNAGVLTASWVNNGIQLTTDGGVSFSTVSGPVQNGLSFVDDQHGVASGYYSDAHYTTNAGRTWITSAGGYGEAWGVYGFAHTSKYIIVPEDYAGPAASRVLTSSDFGVTWTNSYTFPFRTTGAVEGQGRIAYVQTTFPATNGLYRTTDYGASWVAIGGPWNNVDTRFAVVDCGHTVYAFDAWGGVWRSLDAAADVPFGSCSFRTDSLDLLEASLCDSLFRLEFLHNPFGEDASLVDLTILDSSRAPFASTSIRMDSTAALPKLLGSDDSVAMKFGWRPHRLLNHAGQDSCLVRAVYRTSSGSYDTITLTLRLAANITPAHFSASAKSIRVDSIQHCSYRDTTLTISNTGCDTLWLTRAQLGLNSDWSIFDQNGQPLILPLAIPVGGAQNIVLRLRPTRQKQYLDTLKLTLRYFERDSSIRIGLVSTGKVTDAFAGLNGIAFDSLATCVKLDSILMLPNTSCDTIFITAANLNSNDWQLTDLSGQPPKLPIAVPPGATAQLLLRYGPTKLGKVSATLKLRFHYLQFDSIHTIDLTGAGKQNGSLDFASSIDVGKVSVCASADTTIAFVNSSCDPILLDSVAIPAPFELLDSMTLPASLDPGKTLKLRLRFVPQAKTTSHVFGIVRYFFNGGVRSDTIALSAEATAGQSIYAVTPAIGSIAFADRTECDRKDTASFSIGNAGCDTLTVESLSIDGAPVLRVESGKLPVALTGSSQASFDVILDSLIAGDYESHVQIRYRQADGSEVDTTIAVHARIAPGSRTLQLDTSALDLGTFTYCTLHDTTIVYSNTGCLPVTVKGWRMTSYAVGFNVTGSGQYPPITLLPGQSDSLFLFAPSVPGTYYDTIVVTTDADGAKQRFIPVTLTLLPTDSVKFRLLLDKDHLAAGEFTALSVYPDRAVNGKGLTKITGTIECFGDELTMVKSTASSPFALTWGSNVPVGRYFDQLFSVESSGDMSLDPAVPILRMSIRAMVTDTVDCPIVLKDVKLNPDLPDYSKCTLSTAGSAAALMLDRSCGDSTLILDLRGQPLFAIEREVPNPVDASSGFTAKLDVRSEAASSLKISLFDSKGRKVRSLNAQLSARATTTLQLDCSGLPSGSYYYIATSAHGNGQARGSIEVLR